MKTVILGIKHLIVPILFVFFLSLALMASVFSAVVEYFVLGEFFTIPGSREGSIYAPLIIVIVLEGFKGFLHFSIPLQKKAADDRRKILFCSSCKWILVIFSFFCTLIYASNSLYDLNAVDEEIEQVNDEIQLKYDTEREEARKENQAKIDKLIQIEYDKWQAAESKLSNLEPVYSSNARYEKYVNERKALEENVERAKTDYENAVDRIYEEANVELEKTLSAIDEKENDALEALKNQELNTGDNTYLSTALRLFMTIFGFDEDSYSRSIYFKSVLLIAFTLAFILEAMISLGQSYISANEEMLHNMFKTNLKVDDSLKRKFDNILKKIATVLLMLSIYLIAALISEMVVDKGVIISAGVSYAGAIAMTGGKFKVEFTAEHNTSSSFFPEGTQEFLLTLKRKTIPGLIQTLLCITLFLLIGIFFGNGLSDMAPSTMALSIGSIGGQVLLTGKITN